MLPDDFPSKYKVQQYKNINSHGVVTRLYVGNLSDKYLLTEVAGTVSLYSLINPI